MNDGNEEDCHSRLSSFNKVSKYIKNVSVLNIYQRIGEAGQFVSCPTRRRLTDVAKSEFRRLDLSQTILIYNKYRFCHGKRVFIPKHFNIPIGMSRSQLIAPADTTRPFIRIAPRSAVADEQHVVFGPTNEIFSPG